MTDDQRISNIVELARPLDRESLGELAGWIAIELGAMKTADEFRESLQGIYTKQATIQVAEVYIPPAPARECWEPVVTPLPCDVLPGWNE
jgi:hypothetical protein